MNKKDRIAVVVSVLMGIPLIVGMLSGKPEGAIIVFLTPVAFYWAYRFIKNDISFLKVRDD